MTFLFESVFDGDYLYVNAPDLYHAIKIFKEHNNFTDTEKYHIYVRIE